MYRVVVLDSDSRIRNMLAQMPWQSWNLEFLAAFGSGWELLPYLAEADVDMLIADIRLDDMDSSYFFDCLLDIAPHICLILDSDYHNFSMMQQFLDKGIFDYFLKPFSLQSLYQTLQRAIIYMDSRQGQRKKAGKNYVHHRPSLPEGRLKTLLLSGDKDFLVLASHIEHYCRQQMPQRSETVLSVLLGKLYADFLAEFPWLCCLLPEAGKTIRGRHNSFFSQAEAMFQLWDRYELRNRQSSFYRLCELAYEQVETGMTLKKMAVQLGLTADYAGRMFRQKAGLKCSLFLNRLRMERGKQLLKQGQTKNLEISRRLGYSHPDYFRRLFKEYVGMTPTEYRQLHR